MFRRVFLARLLLAALFGALLVPAQAQEKFSEPALSDPDSWTVVLLPDLQGYAKKACNQPIMEIMTSWIAAHAEALNTKLVLCVGDLVEQNDRISNGYSGDQSSHKQWEATARAFSQLDGVVPYMTATGNHDYTYTRTATAAPISASISPSTRTPSTGGCSASTVWTHRAITPSRTPPSSCGAPKGSTTSSSTSNSHPATR